MPSAPHPPNPATSPGGSVTLTCPQCGAQLCTAADQCVEGPCPTCGTSIKYVSPHRTDPATFVPRKPRSGDPAELEFEKPRPASKPARPKKPLTERTRHWLRLVDNFFYSRAGRAISCAALAALLFYCVILFFKWDKRRRARAANPTPPPAVETTPKAETQPSGNDLR